MATIMQMSWPEVSVDQYQQARRDINREVNVLPLIVGKPPLITL